ncbi:hypothetical protein BKA70DRAFT_1535453 [Coprinopsis sp. MPI-PUGE-AT-0042]|nr:hypothetical protein BKA70DRAFT_1535453 [Coprinopsis sp. MPI-PUGE-AT-0042]
MPTTMKFMVVGMNSASVDVKGVVVARMGNTFIPFAGILYYRSTRPGGLESIPTLGMSMPAQYLAVGHSQESGRAKAFVLVSPESGLNRLLACAVQLNENERIPQPVQSFETTRKNSPSLCTFNHDAESIIVVTARRRLHKNGLWERPFHLSTRPTRIPNLKDVRSWMHPYRHELTTVIAAAQIHCSRKVLSMANPAASEGVTTISWPITPSFPWNPAGETGTDVPWPSSIQDLPPIVIPTSLVPSSKKTKVPLGAILGAVFGSLLLCIVLVTLIILRRRRRRGRADMPQVNPFHEAHTPARSTDPAWYHIEPHKGAPPSTPLTATMLTPAQPKLRVPAPMGQVSPSTNTTPSHPPVPSPAPAADLHRDLITRPVLSGEDRTPSDAQQTPAESRQVLEAVRTLQTFLERQPRDVEQGESPDGRTPSVRRDTNIPPPAYQELSR